MGRSQTFALGAIFGTFVLAPLGSWALEGFDGAAGPAAEAAVAPPEPGVPPEVVEAAALAAAAREASSAPAAPPEADETETTTVVVFVGPPAPPLNTVAAGSIEPGQRVAEVLVAAGATQREADLCARALAGKFDFTQSRPGDAYEVEVDPDGRVVRFEYEAAPDEIYRVRLRDEGYAGERVEVVLEHRIAEVTGTIEVSLWEAFVAADASPNLAMALADAFRFDIDFFHDTRKGDRFRFWVDEYTYQGKLVRHGRIHAAEYVGGPESPVGTKRLFWWDSQRASSRGYYDENGRAAQRAFLRSPLKYTRVSSPFGYRRHPILKRRHFHGGVDYAAPSGTPVQAVAGGTVTFAARKGPNGKMVVLSHPGGYASYYLHLSSIHVRRGQSVLQSTVVGRVGSTGRSTGPHLDFRLKKGGKYINPRKHVAPRTKRVPKRERAAYRAAIEPWVAKLEGPAEGG